MSGFRFICPFCDTLLDYPEDLDGVETECPVCHEAIVPTISNGDFSECSEAEKLRKEIDEQMEEFLQEQEQKQEIYPFIAKCPACKKIIELKEELKYSKQQCPFCNKTVLLNTAENAIVRGNINELPNEKHTAHECPYCKDIIIVAKRFFGKNIICSCSIKFFKIDDKNLLEEQGNEDLTDFVWRIKHEAGAKGKEVVLTYPKKQIELVKAYEKKKKFAQQIKKYDKINDCTVGCLAIIGCILVLIGLGSCISSCDTSSTEMSEEAKTYLMLKEAEKKLEKRRKERAVENLVDLMDKGY